MRAEWRVARAEPEAAQALARALGLHPLTGQLLINRGVREPAQAARFLQPTADTLSDPGDIPGLMRAADRLRAAIQQREPIVLFGDSDVDGLTASAILYEVLQELGGQVTAVQSNRLADGYGLPSSLVRRLGRGAPALLLLVDCGTNQADEIHGLAGRGIQTVVVDHHVPLRGAAAPFALVNPHATGGPGQELCSAGLAFKLAQALLQEQRPERLLAFVDLAALGTLADCSRLVGDNRVFVREGLPRIVDSRRRGLRRLCEATATRAADPDQVIRRLIPRLNAGGRLGESANIWRLLLEAQDERMEAWATAAESAHGEVKQLHRQTLAEAFEQVSRLHFKDQHVLVVSRAGWPPGVMGPVAAQLAQQYGRPAIAIAMGDAQGVGSGRSIPLFNLLAAVQACEQWLVRFGGHAQACGMTVDRRHLDAFHAQLNDQAHGALGQPGRRPARIIDLELTLAGLEPGWIGETERFKPFGAGNPKPTVLIRQVRIEPASARTGMVTDGQIRCAARGEFRDVALGARYDVLASPAVTKGLELLVSDARAAGGP